MRCPHTKLHIAIAQPAHSIAISTGEPATQNTATEQQMYPDADCYVQPTSVTRVSTNQPELPASRPTNRRYPLLDQAKHDVQQRLEERDDLRRQLLDHVLDDHGETDHLLAPHVLE